MDSWTYPPSVYTPDMNAKDYLGLIINTTEWIPLNTVEFVVCFFQNLKTTLSKVYTRRKSSDKAMILSYFLDIFYICLLNRFFFRYNLQIIY